MGPLRSASDLGDAVEIIPDKLYLAPVRSEKHVQQIMAGGKALCFSIDNDLLYEPFFADFGPLNLGQAFRYCTKLHQLLEAQAKQPESTRQTIVHCTADDPYRKANSGALMGIFCVLYLDMAADVAYRPLTTLKPFAPFRDASCGASTFHLTVLDCLRGMERAKSVGFVDFQLGSRSSFSLHEYEYYEQVEHGDLNWIVPGKLIAFSGPSAKRTEYGGYRTLVPEDYWDFFHKAGVTAIVRLNKKMYDRRRFLEGGFRHHELYFPDGSCPSEAILMRFLELVEAEPGVVCVHCKAGLGRTGVLICCYLMKHYRFTANEAIGYIRICRPGSVIGPQQHYLREMEAKCHRMGDRMRAQQSQQQQSPSLPAPGTPSPCSSLSSSTEWDAATDHRITSPMKSMHTGTRPSMISHVTGRLSNAINLSVPTPPSTSIRLSSGSSLPAPTRSTSSMFTSGKSAVSAIRSSLPATVRSTSSLPCMPASGGGGSDVHWSVTRTYPPVSRSSGSTSSSRLRRSADERQGHGSMQKAAARSHPHEAAGGAAAGSSTAEVLSRTMRSRGAGTPSPTTSGSRLNSSEQPRDSLVNPMAMTRSSLSPTVGRRPGSSSTSPVMQHSPPVFTGRIVTASGQPRKGAAAAAAAAAMQANLHPHASGVHSPPFATQMYQRTTLTPNPLRGHLVDA